VNLCVYFRFMRIVCFVFLFVSVRLAAQAPDAIFNAGAVGSLENMLASDAMRGRATFTPDIERAADSIEIQFKAAGLQTWNGSASYRQPFTMIRAKMDSNGRQRKSEERAEMGRKR